jgi:hypothetical protein
VHAKKVATMSFRSCLVIELDNLLAVVFLPY